MTLTPRTRFLCCVPPERAATTLGYGQATLAVAGILCVFREILMYFYLFIRYDSDSIYQNYHIRHVKDLSWVLLVLGLCLTFAVFLLVGTEKRRPGYVLTYLIFGVLGTLALAVYWLVLLSGNNRHFIYDGGVDIFLIISANDLYRWTSLPPQLRPGGRGMNPPRLMSTERDVNHDPVPTVLPIRIPY
ncbi:hypothetical protein EVAR_41856_1 [Eumeta japonica]|uniref:Uncharacterized protein n=1 Tax=Eumeta variegata TaxID=151549 RepID=A0A4C1X8S2_EUMVA|nr:hypothetical protein EVAR_41856_1 [Eumeta japonica]